MYCGWKPCLIIKLLRTNLAPAKRRNHGLFQTHGIVQEGYCKLTYLSSGIISLRVSIGNPGGNRWQAQIRVIPEGLMKVPSTGTWAGSRKLPRPVQCPGAGNSRGACNDLQVWKGKGAAIARTQKERGEKTTALRGTEPSGEGRRERSWDRTDPNVIPLRP